MRLHPRHGVMFVAAIAVLAFDLALPIGWTESSPLPWDEAGHYLGALQVHDGLVQGDLRLLGSGLFGADQYPPGHSAALGIWMAFFGVSVASWLTFGLVIYVLTAVLLARLHVAAGLMFVGLGMFGGLAPSLMVEPLAVLWVVLALTLVPSSLESRRDRAAFAGAWLAAGCALLTKYNFGLPLVAALAAAGVIRRDRRMIVATAAAGLLAIGGWALFLTIQEQGWEMFRRFARNRTNSVGMSPWDRIAWYLESFRTHWIASSGLRLAFVGMVVLALVAGARRWRDPRFAGASVLAVGTLCSFALHSYLLSRNLVVFLAAITALIGVGLSRIEWRRSTISIHGAVILIGLISILSVNPQRTEQVSKFFPGDAWDVQRVSAAVSRSFESGGRVRVVGTFNEFSPGWVRLLQMRVTEPVDLAIDIPYPLERRRDRLDHGWYPVYQDIVDSWAADGTREVVAIEVAPGSRFDTTDHERWGRWKLNLVRALESSEFFDKAEDDSLEVGIRIMTFLGNSAGKTIDESDVIGR